MTPGPNLSTLCGKGTCATMRPFSRGKGVLCDATRIAGELRDTVDGRARGSGGRCKPAWM